MDFFDRQFEPAWNRVRCQLAEFVGANSADLLFVENATTGMNLVANNWRLKPGDEVVLNNHEYGAVHRIWRRACERAGTHAPIVARLPDRFESTQQVVDCLMDAVTDRTRMLVVSHITSPSAAIMPVKEICTAAHARGVAVCVDGPHAPAQIKLDINTIGCDFYTASCHKWLSAPFGSGFLTIANRHQERFQPSMLSWGRLLPARPDKWWEEFIWSGTRDPSPYLTIATAIDFFRHIGIQQFRNRTHTLARYARQRIGELTGLVSPIPDSPNWYGSMALAPLPPVDGRELQSGLWQRFQIEIPILEIEGQHFVRVSCHLYNTPRQIDRLVEGLGELIT